MQVRVGSNPIYIDILKCDLCGEDHYSIPLAPHYDIAVVWVATCPFTGQRITFALARLDV